MMNDRDVFALHAMQAILSAEQPDEEIHKAYVAERAYDVADAMIAERTRLEEKTTAEASR